MTKPAMTVTPPASATLFSATLFMSLPTSPACCARRIHGGRRKSDTRKLTMRGNSKMYSLIMHSASLHSDTLFQGKQDWREYRKDSLLPKSLMGRGTLRNKQNPRPCQTIRAPSAARQ